MTKAGPRLECSFGEVHGARHIPFCHAGALPVGCALTRTCLRVKQSNAAVSFGDVLLSESQVRTGPDGGDLSPGAGGWPTIRYFNKGTGYDGAPYAKKTDQVGLRFVFFGRDRRCFSQTVI